MNKVICNSFKVDGRFNPHPWDLLGP